MPEAEGTGVSHKLPPCISNKRIYRQSLDAPSPNGKARVFGSRYSRFESGWGWVWEDYTRELGVAIRGKHGKRRGVVGYELVVHTNTQIGEKHERV